MARTPTQLFFSIILPEDQPGDITIMLDNRDMKVCISAPNGAISCSFDQALELADCIKDGISQLRPSGWAQPGPRNGKAEYEKAHSVDPSRPLHEKIIDTPSTSTAEPDGPNPHYDDPEHVFLIRHEYKDLYYSEDDKFRDERQCTGPKESAYNFRTRYEAYRSMQGMKHPTTLIEHPATHIVSWRCTENDVLHFYNGESAGSLHRRHATHMTAGEADKTIHFLPDPWIKTVHKIWR